MGDRELTSLKLLLVVQMTFWLRRGIIAPVFALFIRRMGISMTQIGLLMMTQMVGWAIFEPTFGVIADRLGKKRLMIYSIITTSIIYVSYTFASSLWHLFLISFAMSSNSAAGAVSSRAMLTELIPPSERGKTYGRYMATLSMGQVFAPLLGGFLTEAVGYTTPFYVSGGLGVASLLAILPLRHDEGAMRGAALYPGPPGMRGLNTRPFLSLLLIRMLYMFNMNFQRNNLPILLHESTGFRASETQIGLYMGILRLASALSQLFLGDLSDRVGLKRLLVFGLFTGGLSYLSLIYLQGVLLLYLLGALQGVFFAATDLSMMIHMMRIIPRESSGKAMGFYGLSEDVGGIIAAPSLGAIYDLVGPLSSAISVSGILMGDAALSILLVKTDDVEGEER